MQCEWIVVGGNFDHRSASTSLSGLIIGRALLSPEQHIKLGEISSNYCVRNSRIRAMGHSVVTRADAQSPWMLLRRRKGPGPRVLRRVKFPPSAPQTRLCPCQGCWGLAVTGIACMSKPGAPVIPGISRIPEPLLSAIALSRYSRYVQIVLSPTFRLRAKPAQVYDVQW